MAPATCVTPYYEEDGVVIYHDDCRLVFPSLPTESVDFVLTDPPYLVNYRGRWDGDRKTIVGDDDPSLACPRVHRDLAAAKARLVCGRLLRLEAR